MNIKGIMGQFAPVEAIKKVTNRNRRAELAGDRDPNKDQEGGNQPEKRPLRDEELEEVIKYLKAIPGVQENSLQFRVEKHDERVVLFVEDLTGKIVRRITDYELLAILRQRSSGERGTLLNKSM